jgi:hypothetical protein
VPEVDVGALIEVDEAVVQPPAQVRQAEQPGTRGRIRGLDAPNKLLTAPQSGSPAAAIGGRGNGMQQQHMLTQLRIVQELDLARIAFALSECQECRFLEPVIGGQN